MKDGNKEKLVFVGVGCILGCFLSRILFMQFGIIALDGLTVMGVVVFILGFLHVYTSNSNYKKAIQEDKERSEAKLEDKTLLDKIRVWKT